MIKNDYLADLQAAFKTPEDFKREILNMPSPAIISDMIPTQSERYNKTRENQIREKLKENGYTFETETPGELFIFLSTRCRIEYYEQTKLIVLYADGKLITQWYDTIDIQTNFDPETQSVKSILTYGKPPL